MKHCTCNCGTFKRHEPGCVMIVHQSRYSCRVRIQSVVFQLLTKSTHRKLVCKDQQRSVPQRKIENGIQLCVNAVPAFVSTKEEGSLSGIAFKNLTNHPELW